MPVESSQVVDIQTRRSGNIRARFEYHLTDGRVITIGPMSFASLSEAETAIGVRSSAVLEEVQQRDAEQAVELGVITAHKEAALKDVYRAWLWEGFYEPESRRGYRILKVIVAKVIALGWSITEMAVQFKTDEATVQKLLDRWQYLNSNKDVIEAYALVKQGDL